MDVFDAIAGRRSIGKMRSESPTRDQIEKLLQAAAYAPNHHETEPWRFFVLAGDTRSELGQIMMENLQSKMVETESEKAKAALEKERNKPLRAPVLIVVACKYNPEDRSVEIEEVEAVSAATQNMLLAAQALGLSTIWRTGDAAYSPRVKEWLGLEQTDHIIGIIYVGYPAVPVSERAERVYQDKTKWLGWKENN